MLDEPLLPACSQCGRPALERLRGCTERECPYQLTRRNADDFPSVVLPPHVRKTLTIAGTVIGIAFILPIYLVSCGFGANSDTNITTILFFAPFAFFACWLVSKGVQRLVRLITLKHTQTGSIWQQYRLFGVPLITTIHDEAQPLEFKYPCDSLPSLPFSILGIQATFDGIVVHQFSVEDAIIKLQFALVGLYHRGDVRFIQSQPKMSMFWGTPSRTKPVYLVESSLSTPLHEVGGSLEHGLLLALHASAPMSFYDLVRSALVTDSTNPSWEIVDRVLKDASARGFINDYATDSFGLIKQLFSKKRVTVAPSFLADFQQQKAAANAAWSAVFNQEPDMAYAMREDFRDAIKSRTDTGY